MTPFVVYDPATGGVLRAGACPSSVLEAQAQPGEAVLPLQYIPGHMVVGGHLVPIPEETP